MDRGEKERLERQKVKEIVARNAKRRRASKHAGISSPGRNMAASPNCESLAEESILITESVPDNGLRSSPVAGAEILDARDVYTSPKLGSSSMDNNFANDLPSPSWVTSYSYLSEPETFLSQSEPRDTSTGPDSTSNTGYYAGTPDQNISAPEAIRSNTVDNSSLVKSREHEATLLMHYLDRVFPLQYRFYRPSETDDGRGWLLALLTRTKPLYHAALSLSALHLQVLQNIRAEEREERTADTSVELYKHHDLALKELQHYIQLEQQTDDVNGKLQVLACTVQFISFEVRQFSCLGQATDDM